MQITYWQNEKNEKPLLHKKNHNNNNKQTKKKKPTATLNEQTNNLRTKQIKSKS